LVAQPSGFARRSVSCDMRVAVRQWGQLLTDVLATEATAA
jgi:hypothetical protein